ncbi:MAG: hypothetical protein RL220_676 [Bacteroidota bacterium]
MPGKILVLGAGRSSTSLIDYLLKFSESEDWTLRIGDGRVEEASAHFAPSERCGWFRLDADDHAIISNEMAGADLVISMLPASFHPMVAEQCLQHGKHLITPSYVSEAMKSMHEKAIAADLIFLNEMGLDPGIDHMSAMAIINEIKDRGGKIFSFESYTGGLVAPESDDNPWHYKISWNPRNVVLAGSGSPARYLKGGRVRYIPYHRLFAEAASFDLGINGRYEGYANRDSVKYREVYGLHEIDTLIRGTFRKGAFCRAWNVLVNLGLTDDTVEIPDASDMSWADLTAAFAGSESLGELYSVIREIPGVDDEVISMLEWLGIFGDEQPGIENGTPAAALQKLIEKRWVLAPDDKDMIVMMHRFRYESGGKMFERISTLVDTGKDNLHTAMARTVGLPVGVAARLILNGKIQDRGVILPVEEEIYRPVLEQLLPFGISFTESEREI